MVDTNKFVHTKCSAKECRFIAKRAQTEFSVLADDSQLKHRAKMFRALGNHTRLRILGLLAVQEMCTCDIVEALKGATSTITHHLRILEEGSLLTARQVSRFTLYNINKELLKKHRIFDESHRDKQ